MSNPNRCSFVRIGRNLEKDKTMLKGGLLWLMGVPLSLIIVLALVGVI
jgi:hypothetical protein